MILRPSLDLSVRQLHNLSELYESGQGEAVSLRLSSGGGGVCVCVCDVCARVCEWGFRGGWQCRKQRHQMVHLRAYLL